MMNVTEEKNGGRRQFITFRSEQQEFGADIMSIREIRGWTATTPLANTPACVRGVINLRGVVLPVVDLKARLGLGQTEATSKHVIVVVQIGGRAVGLLVDAVSDVMEASLTDIQTTPELAQETQNEFAEGIAILDQRMVTILSLEKLIATLAGGESKAGRSAQEAPHAAA